MKRVVMNMRPESTFGIGWTFDVIIGVSDAIEVDKVLAALEKEGAIEFIRHPETDKALNE